MSTDEKDVKNDEMFEGGEGAGDEGIVAPPEEEAAAYEAKQASESRWAKRREELRTYEIKRIVSYKNEDRCVVAIREDAGSMRLNMERWNILRGELSEAEMNLQQVWEHKFILTAEHARNVEANELSILALRRELAAAKGTLSDSKTVYISNHQARDEVNVHNEGIHWDIQKHKHQFDECNQKNSSLIAQQKLYTEQHADLVKVNGIDLEEINRLNAACAKQESEAINLTGQAETLDASVKQLHVTVESVSKCLHDKTNELNTKTGELMSAEAEICMLNDQIAQFNSHIAYLKSVHEKCTMENTDIQGRVTAETAKNAELHIIIRDIESKIGAKENQVKFLLSSIECARNVNCSSLQNNDQLQTEIDACGSHIHVISHQNKELSVELDHFAAQNEAMRANLDRAVRVNEVRAINEHQIAHSTAHVVRAKEIAREISRSPIRHHVMHEPVHYEKRIIDEKRTPVEWRLERSVERVQVGTELQRVPVSAGLAGSHYSTGGFMDRHSPSRIYSTYDRAPLHHTSKISISNQAKSYQSPPRKTKE